MAVKMKKPDYWPALEEGERLAGIQRERDARRRSIITNSCLIVKKMCPAQYFGVIYVLYVRI